MAEHEHVWYAVNPIETPNPDLPKTVQIKYTNIRCAVCKLVGVPAADQQDITVDLTGTDTSAATEKVLAEQTP